MSTEGFSIAVITHDAEEGGSVGSVAWNHIKLLANQYHVYVISRGIPETENPRIHPILICPKTWNGLRRFCHVPNELSFQRSARKALNQLSKEINLKAVWCHSHGTVTLSASPTARQKGLAVIMTTHGDIFERPVGTYDYLMTLFYKFVTKRAYAVADRVHALSPYMGDLAVKHGAKKEKIRIIPNGVYPREIGLEHVLFREQSMFTRNEGLKVLFVGNLLPIKGLRHLIRALKIAQLKGSNDIYLQCVGDGLERQALQNLTSELGLVKQVTFVGKVVKNKLHRFYASADVFCVPSDSDPLPTVVLEAFSAGLPVVGTATGGISYMVSDERGFLFEPGNSDELAEILVRAAGNKAALFELSRECSAAAKDEFSWDNVGNQLRVMLSECIAEKSGAREKIHTGRLRGRS